MKQRLLRAMALFLCCITAALLFQGCGSGAADKKKEKEESSSIGSTQQSDSSELEMGAYQPVQIPDQLKEFLKNQYPQATILEYDREKNSIEVDIIDEKTYKVVVFSLSYEWLYTEWDIQYKNLPEAVKNAAEQACGDTHYIDDVAVYEYPNGKRYLIEGENRDKEFKLWFDESGNKV